jgi:multidrug resistance efflux pump
LRAESSIPGPVESVDVREGEYVKAGQVLATVDSSLARIRVEEAAAQLRIARAGRDPLVRAVAAGRDVNRGRSGGPQRTGGDGDRSAAPIRQSAWDAESQTSESETSIEARISLAEAVLRREKLMLGRCKLRAPIGGLVLSVCLQPGELVGPNHPHKSVTIVDTTRKCVRAYVEEFDVDSVHPGNRASVTTSGPRHREFKGAVVACSPCVRPKSHRHQRADERFDVRVREVLIELNDDPDLLIGLPVEVFIEPNHYE